MNVLCVCNHGNVRSVALARAIKDISFNKEGHPHEAIAIGAQITSEDTFTHMLLWADTCVWLSEAVPINDEIKRIAKTYQTSIVDAVQIIGPDRWHDAFHPELREMTKKLAKEVLNEN